MDSNVLIIGFGMLILLSVVVCYGRYRRDRAEGKELSRNFFTSERIFVFIIEILIAFIGFGMTLAIANANERQMEKNAAIQMTEQVIAYMDREVEWEYQYLLGYDKGEMTGDMLRVSSVTNTVYYESVLTNELILKYANMDIHGEVMRFMVWADWATAQADETTDEAEIRKYLWDRYSYHLKMRNLLQVSYDEMVGEITAEEAEDKRRTIRSRTNEEEVKIYEGTPTGVRDRKSVV